MTRSKDHTRYPEFMFRMFDEMCSQQPKRVSASFACLDRKDANNLRLTISCFRSAALPVAGVGLPLDVQNDAGESVRKHRWPKLNELSVRVRQDASGVWWVDVYNNGLDENVVRWAKSGGFWDADDEAYRQEKLAGQRAFEDGSDQPAYAHIPSDAPRESDS